MGDSIVSIWNTWTSWNGMLNACQNCCLLISPSPYVCVCVPRSHWSNSGRKLVFSLTKFTHIHIYTYKKEWFRMRWVFAHRCFWGWLQYFSGYRWFSCQYAVHSHQVYKVCMCACRSLWNKPKWVHISVEFYILCVCSKFWWISLQNERLYST